MVRSGTVARGVDLDRASLTLRQNRHGVVCNPHPSSVEAAGSDLFPPNCPAFGEVGGNGGLDAVNRSGIRGLLDWVYVHQDDVVAYEGEREASFPKRCLVVHMDVGWTVFISEHQFDMEGGPWDGEQLHRVV